MTERLITDKLQIDELLASGAEYFAHGQADQPGIGFDFKSDPNTFQDAVEQLGFDRLLDEEELVRIITISMADSEMGSHTMGWSIPDIKDLSVVEILKALQMTGLSGKPAIPVASKVILGHLLNEDAVDVSRPVAQVGSVWRNGQIIDRIMGAPTTLGQELGKDTAKMGERERLAAIAKLLHSGNFAIQSPLREYYIRIGRPAVGFLRDVRGTSVDETRTFSL